MISQFYYDKVYKLRILLYLYKLYLINIRNREREIMFII